MWPRVFVGVFLLLMPTVAVGQSVRADGCISGQPCDHGVPLPPPKQGMWQVDADGCLMGEPCPYRNRSTTPKTDTTASGTSSWRRDNPDGSVDRFFSNSHTGSQWDQHYGDGVQSGHNKDGVPWGPTRLAPQFVPSAYPHQFVPDGPLDYVDEPSEHDRWEEEWRRTGGTMQPSRVSTSPSEADRLVERRLRDEYAKQVAAQEQARADASTMATVLSRMQPGVLAEAARAAARQRCLTITGENERNTCLEAANKL
jgi:hypothetical protein